MECKSFWQQLLVFACAIECLAAERPPTSSDVEDDGDFAPEQTRSPSSDFADFGRSHFDRRFAAISKAQGALETEDPDDETGEAPVESLEVRPSAHAIDLRRTHMWDRHSRDTKRSWREKMLQRQLEASRAAESLQIAEQQEAEDLDLTQGLLGEVKRKLAKKSKEAQTAEDVLARSVKLASDLRAAVSKAERDASAARNEAMVARRGSAIQSTRARENLEAANEVVEEAGEAAEEVSRERQLLQAQERHAEMERHKALEARRRYELELKKAKLAQSQAEEERQRTLAEKLALETKESMAFEQVAEERAETEKQRKQHYEAAVAMKEKTEEAQAVALLASKERSAAEKEKAKATQWRRQADADKASAMTFSYISWGLMFIAGLTFVALSTDVRSCGPAAKALGLRPVWLLQNAIQVLAILRCRRMDGKKEHLSLAMPPACPQLLSIPEETTAPKVSLGEEVAIVADVSPPSESDMRTSTCGADDGENIAPVGDASEQQPSAIQEDDSRLQAS